MSDLRAAGPFVEILNPNGSGNFVIVCEHASNAMPAEFDNLGLDDATLQSHIAWDPGARAVAVEMSRLLDAPLVAQKASRLLYDCNRPPHEPSAMPAVSEVFAVPGNANLSEAERARRAEIFYYPFRQTLSDVIDARPNPPTIVTIHSFTPIYHGKHRPVEIGILHDSDSKVADRMLEAARLEGTRYDIRRNEPYGPQDGVTHTLREHAISRKLPNVMIEIRSDLIADQNEHLSVADLVARWILH